MTGGIAEMSTEIFEALKTLEKERGIPMDFMVEKIRKAIITACKNSYNGNDEAVININEETGQFDVHLMKTVVEDVKIKGKEISLEDARKIDANAGFGEKVAIKLDTKEFGRIAAQTARNIIRQGIKDGERSQLTLEFQHKQNQIVSALIERIDSKSRAMTLRIGKAESTLPFNEQIGNEKLKEGDHVKVYVSDVQVGDKGPKVMISRTHPGFVKKMFEMEVPEISSGVVEIKSVAREAGSRSKLAVQSKDKNVDAIGSCIGSHGARINTILSELGGEKIDIIEYSDDYKKFISAALAPANVLKVEIDDEASNCCKVTVPDNQLSLAIGNRGQNVRLAARLTGFKIDIRPEIGFYGESEDKAEVSGE